VVQIIHSTHEAYSRVTGVCTPASIINFRSNEDSPLLAARFFIKLPDNEESSPFLDDHFPHNVRCVSVITQIELLAYPDITQEADKLIHFFLADIPIIAIEGDIAEAAIQIRQSKPHIKLPDAVIAPSALALNVATAMHSAILSGDQLFTSFLSSV
jgi:predicted nucleic acid-binding protein